MATVYIPDPLNSEVYMLLYDTFPNGSQKELLKHRNEFVNTSVREKLNRDNGGVIPAR